MNSERIQKLQNKITQLRESIQSQKLMIEDNMEYFEKEMKFSEDDDDNNNNIDNNNEDIEFQQVADFPTDSLRSMETVQETIRDELIPSLLISEKNASNVNARKEGSSEFAAIGRDPEIDAMEPDASFRAKNKSL